MISAYSVEKQTNFVEKTNYIHTNKIQIKKIYKKLAAYVCTPLNKYFHEAPFYLISAFSLLGYTLDIKSSVKNK